MTSHIQFDPINHRYFDAFGRDYKSVSALLAEAYPFDRVAIMEKVSKMPNSRYYGMTVDEISAEWDDRRSSGTDLHKGIQDWIVGKELPPETSPDFHGVKFFSEGTWKGVMQSEVLLYNSLLHIAGTADIVNRYPDHIVIWDIKTCRKIDQEKLLKYSIQLKFYATMAEEQFGVKAHSGGIIWFENYVENRSVFPQVLSPVACDEEYLKISFKRVLEALEIKEKEIQKFRSNNDIKTQP